MIGLTDAAVEGELEWSDGTILDYTNWDTNEPQNDATKNCVVMAFGGDARWEMADCAATTYYGLCRY